MKKILPILSLTLLTTTAFAQILSNDTTPINKVNAKLEKASTEALKRHEGNVTKASINIDSEFFDIDKLKYKINTSTAVARTAWSDEASEFGLNAQTDTEKNTTTNEDNLKLKLSTDLKSNILKLVNFVSKYILEEIDEVSSPLERFTLNFVTDLSKAETIKIVHSKVLTFINVIKSGRFDNDQKDKEFTDAVKKLKVVAGEGRLSITSPLIEFYAVYFKFEFVSTAKNLYFTIDATDRENLTGEYHEDAKQMIRKALDYLINIEFEELVIDVSGFLEYVDNLLNDGF